MVKTHGLTHISLAGKAGAIADPDGYEIEIWYE